MIEVNAFSILNATSFPSLPALLFSGRQDFLNPSFAYGIITSAHQPIHTQLDAFSISLEFQLMLAALSTLLNGLKGRVKVTIFDIGP